MIEAWRECDGCDKAVTVLLLRKALSIKGCDVVTDVTRQIVNAKSQESKAAKSGAIRFLEASKVVLFCTSQPSHCHSACLAKVSESRESSHCRHGCHTAEYRRGDG